MTDGPITAFFNALRRPKTVQRPASVPNRLFAVRVPAAAPVDAMGPAALVGSHEKILPGTIASLISGR